MKQDNHKFVKDSLEREQTYKKTISDLSTKVSSVDRERQFWQEKVDQVEQEFDSQTKS
jgi:phage shock protein A